MRIEADRTALLSAARDFDHAGSEIRGALAALSGAADAAASGAGLAAGACESMWAAWSSALAGAAGRLDDVAGALRFAAETYTRTDRSAIPRPDT